MKRGLYRDQGVVIRTIKLGETDRIVTLLTRGHGRIRAVAKGVRKPGSRFGARLEPASHVALQCYRGRELDIITQVETIDANRSLREHYGSLTHAVSMLEAVDQVAPEREPNVALYRMLTNALQTLAREPSPLVSAAFLWKLLPSKDSNPCSTRVCVAEEHRTTTAHSSCSTSTTAASCARGVPASGVDVSEPMRWPWSRGWSTASCEGCWTRHLATM